jgi:hypothetical protein
MNMKIPYFIIILAIYLESEFSEGKFITTCIIFSKPSCVINYVCFGVTSYGITEFESSYIEQIIEINLTHQSISIQLMFAAEMYKRFGPSKMVSILLCIKLLLNISPPLKLSDMYSILLVRYLRNLTRYLSQVGIFI